MITYLVAHFIVGGLYFSLVAGIVQAEKKEKGEENTGNWYSPKQLVRLILTVCLFCIGWPFVLAYAVGNRIVEQRIGADQRVKMRLDSTVLMHLNGEIDDLTGRLRQAEDAARNWAMMKTWRRQTKGWWNKKISWAI